MYKYLVFALFLAVGISQPVLSGNCDVQADKYGFVQLEAFAAYFVGDEFYCYNTNVSAIIEGADYQLDELYTCYYTKMIQLAPGEYSMTYYAEYPDYESQQFDCILTVASAQTMNIVVYGLKDNSTFLPNAYVSIEAVAVLEGRNVDASMTATLIGADVLKEITLTKDVLGTKVGSMLLNVSEGNYVIRLRADYEDIVVQRDFNIKVTSVASVNQTASGLNLIVIEPEDIVYPENSNLYLQVELQDANNKIVSGATVKADVYKGTKKLDTVDMAASSWYYHGKYFFEETGEYKIVYTATKSGASASAQVVFFVGNRSELSEDVNFTVNIVSPSSSVYIKDSVINVRAKVTQDGEAVKDASVVVFFEGREIEMDYDQFGNYIASIGPLTEGEYSLKVVASKDELISQDSTLFMISKHILNIDTISPYYNQEFELKRGDSLNIKAIVLDEDRDIVPGALVVAKILEPNGRALQMQLFQDGTTGYYSANFYLDDLNGKYSLAVEASKAGYVPVSKDSQFSIQFESEQQMLSGYLTTENLITLILVVAILILLAAFLRALL